MSHITEFSISGLAGSDQVYSQKLNQDVNVFFGLNGSGKTSLLKILHSAMSDDQAKEIPGSTGGKPALIAFFLYFGQNSALLDNFKGKKTGILFFLDKDVDDLLRKQRRSEHVVYTQYYDVENHIFVEGDLGKAAAAAASMDYQQIIAGIGDYKQWRYQVAEKWKQWVKLCLFARKKNIGCECTYSNPSKVNNPLYNLLDSTIYAQYLNLLETRSGLSSIQFKNAFKRVSKQVDDFYIAGEQDRIFKGKWYAGFLEAKITNIAGNTPFNSKTLSNRLITAITMTLDFDAPWAEHFKEPSSGSHAPCVGTND